MLFNKRFKIGVFVFVIILFAVSVYMGLYRENNYCMGLPVVSESVLNSYIENLNYDITNINYNGEDVAVDINSKTIYISQPKSALDHSHTLIGEFKSNDFNYRLCLLNDDNIKNISDSVSNGRPLTLIIINGNSYCRVNVIISTLPIISLSGEESGEYSSKGKPVYSGDMIMIAGMNPATDSADTSLYSAKWHIRGASSAEGEKKPWKLSLKSLSGNNLDANLLGMGEDDDWILNPMNLDDTKLREKISMDLWNQYIIDSKDENKMSTGEYVEVIMNGEYQGLYLLQRRVDAKYLNINKKTDIIFKGLPIWQTTDIYAGYEIVYSPFDYTESYEILNNALNNESGNGMVLNNFINTNLFLKFLSAYDNVGYKNMFYVLRANGDGYDLFLVPWDTDMSMGLAYADGFVCRHEATMRDYLDRMEYDKMKILYPELDTMMRDRWIELQDNVFEEGVLEDIIETNIQRITENAAYIRDNERWGLYYGDLDTMDSLSNWCRERVEKMSEYYTQ